MYSYSQSPYGDGSKHTPLQSDSSSLPMDQNPSTPLMSTPMTHAQTYAMDTRTPIDRLYTSLPPLAALISSTESNYGNDRPGPYPPQQPPPQPQGSVHPLSPVIRPATLQPSGAFSGKQPYNPTTSYDQSFSYSQHAASSSQGSGSQDLYRPRVHSTASDGSATNTPMPGYGPTFDNHASSQSGTRFQGQNSHYYEERRGHGMDIDQSMDVDMPLQRTHGDEETPLPSGYPYASRDSQDYLQIRHSRNRAHTFGSSSLPPTLSKGNALNFARDTREGLHGDRQYMYSLLAYGRQPTSVSSEPGRDSYRFPLDQSPRESHFTRRQPEDQLGDSQGVHAFPQSNSTNSSPTWPRSHRAYVDTEDTESQTSRYSESQAYPPQTPPPESMEGLPTMQNQQFLSGQDPDQTLFTVFSQSSAKTNRNRKATTLADISKRFWVYKCSRCRRMKQKCDVRMPKCWRCERAGVECVYPDASEWKGGKVVSIGGSSGLVERERETSSQSSASSRLSADAIADPRPRRRMTAVEGANMVRLPEHPGYRRSGSIPHMERDRYFQPSISSRSSTENRLPLRPPQFSYSSGTRNYGGDHMSDDEYALSSRQREVYMDSSLPGHRAGVSNIVKPDYRSHQYQGSPQSAAPYKHPSWNDSDPGLGLHRSESFSTRHPRHAEAESGKPPHWGLLPPFKPPSPSVDPTYSVRAWQSASQYQKTPMLGGNQSTDSQDRMHYNNSPAFNSNTSAPPNVNAPSMILPPISHLLRNTNQQ